METFGDVILLYSLRGRQYIVATTNTRNTFTGNIVYYLEESKDSKNQKHTHSLLRANFCLDISIKEGIFHLLYNASASILKGRRKSEKVWYQI